LNDLHGLENLVKTLNALAKKKLSDAERQREGYFPQGLYQGAALAYENAAQWLERELEQGRKKND
jgi:hypothetical protein